MNKIDGKVMF